MKNLYSLIIFTVISFTVAAQNIGIGTAAPNASAILELKASDKGLLIPRTSTTSRIAIVNPAKGLLVYDTTSSSFWFHSGISWVQIVTGGSGWSLTGNAGTNPANNFIGTTDATPLILKVNGVRAGFIDNNINENTSFGYQSLLANTTGVKNTAIGLRTLSNNTTGYQNTAIGDSALFSNTDGFNNTANGAYALYANISGKQNTAIGYSTLIKNTNGDLNTALGTGALYQNLTGSNNAANGAYGLFSNTSGQQNTANGFASLYSNVTGSYNTGTGAGALNNNTASWNTATGAYAMYQNQSGISNTATGAESLYSNDFGAYNTASGYRTLYANTIGTSNTADGALALSSNTTGTSNTAIGTDALRKNTIGNDNTAIGTRALYSNYFVIDFFGEPYGGNANTAVGKSALYFNGIGRYNTAIGTEALYHNLGSNSTALGAYALRNNISVGDNTAIGYYSLEENQGHNNVGVGVAAMANGINVVNNTIVGDYTLSKNINGGDNNVAVGYLAGLTENALTDYFTDCVFIGAEAGAKVVVNPRNSIAIGKGVMIDAHNQVRIGAVGTTSIGGYAGWSNISDVRYKENLREDVNGIAFILKLRPVTYNLNLHSLYKSDNIPDSVLNSFDFSRENIRYSGFIAQEVEAAAKSLNFDFSGVDKPDNPEGKYSLRYSEFVVPLVKAVQEQQQIIEDQNKKIELLLKEMQLMKETIKQINR